MIDLESFLGPRTEYQKLRLEKKDLKRDPREQFLQWYRRTARKGTLLPQAAFLATADQKCHPYGRIVLVKTLSKEGFVFYTSYDSPKARQIEKNPRGELTFYWLAQEQQVRVRGRITKARKDISEAYFRARPRATQIGAWASRQSAPVLSREQILKKCQYYEKKFSGQEIPLPPHWGGYLLKPNYFEFWQGRLDRLNDRFAYRQRNGRWAIGRLQP